ncbi:hypothetical protein Tco_0434471 [Tanacetum coccineum]
MRLRRIALNCYLLAVVLSRSLLLGLVVQLLVLLFISVVYVLTTPIPKDENATVEQIIKRAKWDNDDYVCRVMEQYNELLRILERFTQHKMNMDEAIQVSCIVDKLPPSWKDFKHTLKHLKKELTLFELGSHLRT